jgi:site-specific DNA-methyltransferase (adenine-specific)
MITPYYQDEDVTLYCGKCEEILPQLNVRADLLLTDPPYGLGERWQGGTWAEKEIYKEALKWDAQKIDNGWLKQIIDYSEKAIVWGGNYYELPPTRCWLSWEKPKINTMADFELAWTNLEQPAKSIKHIRQRDVDWHATAKPIYVIKWCIDVAKAERGQLLLDPYCGSGTSLVAAKVRGLKSIGIEANEGYCKLIVEERLNRPMPLFAATN